MLEDYIKKRMQEKEILLMTHIVLGYPTLEDSLALVDTMVKAGVDVMELQIPFSEPMADGPVILKANQDALGRGVRVAECFECAGQIAANYEIPFLFMSYYNILYKYGLQAFARKSAEAGIKGAIVPDIPPEEGKDYLQAMAENSLDPIFIYAPTTTDERMAVINSQAKGFVYCVARKGVTGEETDFSNDLDSYLARCRKGTDLPLALGFGVKDRSDVSFLSGKVEMAVVGSQAIRILDEKGVSAVGDFIHGLRS